MRVMEETYRYACGIHKHCIDALQEYDGPVLKQIGHQGCCAAVATCQSVEHCQCSDMVVARMMEPI